MMVLNRLFAAYAAFSIGAGVLLFYLPMHVFSLGGSMLDVAVLMTIQAGVAILFSGVWGRVSDVMRTRTPFMILGMAALSTFLFLLTILQTKTQVLLALAAFTILTCATEPAIQAYVTSRSSASKEKGAAAGGINACNYLGIAVAALAGGFVYDKFGFGAVALLASAAGVAGTALMLGLREEEFAGQGGGAKSQQQNRHPETVDVVGGVVTRLLVLYLVIFVLMVGLSAFGPISSVYLIQLGNSRTVYGVLTALSFVVGGIISPRIGRIVDRYGSRNVLLAGALTYLGIFTFIYFVKSPLPVLLAWSIPVYILCWIPAMTVVANGTSTARRGTGMGLLTSFKNVGLVLGSLTGGLLASGGAAGIGHVLTFSAVTSAIGVLLVLFRLGR